MLMIPFLTTVIAEDELQTLVAIQAFLALAKESLIILWLINPAASFKMTSQSHGF